MSKFKATEYLLQCVATGRTFEDAGWTLDDKECRTPSLVRTLYATKQLTVRPELGLYAFVDWLPVHRMFDGSAAPVTYRSVGLATYLGLQNLYITFNGYNPMIDARMTSCSFKEAEAYSVCGRIPQGESRVLVVASAGNSARAFAKVCSAGRIPLLLCVPADNIEALWFDKPLSSCVKLITTESGSDYFDAISLAEKVLHSRHFFDEGGAKNVARRDGMGTSFLSATTTIGRIPDYYFQAVGSGTGAVAAWEANLRLIEDGRYGNHKTRLIVSQNAPFAPIYEAWQAGSRDIPHYDDYHARRDAAIIDAKVLSNRRPPYNIAGGLYDALKDTNGDVMIVTNTAARKAAQLFERLEGVDIHPAAAVATASLIRAVQSGTVNKSATISLNITGGGERCYKATRREMHTLTPSATFRIDTPTDEVVTSVEKLFGFATRK